MALPARKGAPIALVIPIVDLAKAIDRAGAGKAAAIESYLLVTGTDTDLTGWRYYAGMPEVAVLKRDRADASAGRIGAMFRNGADGRTTLFVPRTQAWPASLARTGRAGRCAGGGPFGDTKVGLEETWRRGEEGSRRSRCGSGAPGGRRSAGHEQEADRGFRLLAPGVPRSGGSG